MFTKTYKSLNTQEEYLITLCGSGNNELTSRISICAAHSDTINRPFLSLIFNGLFHLLNGNTMNNGMDATLS